MYIRILSQIKKYITYKKYMYKARKIIKESEANDKRNRHIRV